MIPIRFKILERGIPNLNEEYIGQLIEDCTLVFIWILTATRVSHDSDNHMDVHDFLFQ